MATPKYVKEHLKRLQRLDECAFLAMIVQAMERNGLRYLKKLAKARFLEGHKKHGKWRDLDFVKEANEELADFITYTLEGEK